MTNAINNVNVDFLNREIKPGDLVSHVSSGYTQILFSRVASFSPKKIRLTRLMPKLIESGRIPKAHQNDDDYMLAIPSQVCLVQTVDGRPITTELEVIE